MQQHTATSNKHTGSSFLDPERIVARLEIERGGHIADFGAGHGYFTVPLARIVGGDGRVYAFDIQRSVLDVIRTRASTEHLLNIEAIWADLDEWEGSKLRDKLLDMVLIANTLFQCENKSALIVEAARVVHEDGRVIIIDWGMTQTPFGPSLKARIPKNEVINIAEAAGLKFDKEIDAGTYHYGLIFKK